MSKKKRPGVGRGKADASHLRTGDQIYEGADNEKAKAKERERLREMGLGGGVYDFFLTPGNEAEVIILDESIKAGCALYQHKIWRGKGQKPVTVMCAQELDFDCPVCATGNQPQYMAKLTVLELTPWESESGKSGDYSKRVLSIPWTALGDFRELEQMVLNAGYESLRGIKIRLKRGEAKTSRRIGEIKPLMDGSGFEPWTGDELEEYYGHAARKGDDGTVLAPKNFDITPYDYAEIFKAPTEKELRSAASIEESEFDDGVDDDDDIPMEHDTDSEREDDRTWEAIGESADEGDEDDSADLGEALTGAGLDENNYETWAEAGAALDELEEEDPVDEDDDGEYEEDDDVDEDDAEDEGEDGEEEDGAATWEAIGTAADGGDKDSEAELKEACESYGVDSDSFGTWADVGVELDRIDEEDPDGGEDDAGEEEEDAFDD